ncbi:MAG: hypothetical protein GTO63_24435 [Anaerolineae bacterium]|nr:hypothetical protein [Anaerolineae bacterium]NIN97871.1 hypothetical protein [Anaerolineae bacterium]NIQ80850.1 hypothetical protein [Anaerolineae bacterium]
MKPSSRLAVIIVAIVGGSLLAFCAGIVFTLAVIMPARRETGQAPLGTFEPTVEASASQPIRPSPTKTLVEPRPTATYAIIILTPAPTAEPTPSSTLVQSPAPPASPTPRPGLPFYYVEGSRIEQDNCFSMYLKGLVIDANDVPLDGVTIRWERWQVSEFYVSGSDPTAPRGQWTFDYMPGDRHMPTDFVLQVVESEGNLKPLSDPLVIHYAGCSINGQITRIVFKRR